MRSPPVGLPAHAPVIRRLLSTAGGLLSTAAGLLLAGGICAADSRPAWQDDFQTRLAAFALLETLNAELLSHDSATATLEHWCAEHRMAVPARVIAQRVAGADKPASPGLRSDLHVSESEPLRYRRVRLNCGAVTLSEAENWYVPGRLTAAMNRQLNTSETPFGKVVQPLRFQRRTLSAELLWHPLPDGWEMGSAPPEIPVPAPAATGVLAVPAQVLQHRAVLSLPDGTPFSEVLETYTDAILAFSRGGAQSSPN